MLPLPTPPSLSPLQHSRARVPHATGRGGRPSDSQGRANSDHSQRPACHPVDRLQTADGRVPHCRTERDVLRRWRPRIDLLWRLQHDQGDLGICRALDADPLSHRLAHPSSGRVHRVVHVATRYDPRARRCASCLRHLLGRLVGHARPERGAVWLLHRAAVRRLLEGCAQPRRSRLHRPAAARAAARLVAAGCVEARWRITARPPSAKAAGQGTPARAHVELAASAGLRLTSTAHAWPVLRVAVRAAVGGRERRVD